MLALFLRFARWLKDSPRALDALPRDVAKTERTALLEHTLNMIGKAHVIHARNLPCPPGYRLMKKYFRERDGLSEDAYVTDDPRCTVTIDYLLGGEQCSIGLRPYGIDAREDLL